MKQATQLAFYGTVAIVIFQIISFIANQYFGFGGETIYFLVRIVDLFGMLTLVNFFYKLHQKQNQKISNIDSNNFKE